MFICRMFIHNSTNEVRLDRGVCMASLGILCMLWCVELTIVLCTRPSIFLWFYLTVVISFS